MMTPRLDRIPETPGSDQNIDRATMRELQALTDCEVMELVAEITHGEAMDTIINECRDERQRNEAVCAIVSRILLLAGVSKILVDHVVTCVNLSFEVTKQANRMLAKNAEAFAKDNKS